MEEGVFSYITYPPASRQDTGSSFYPEENGQNVLSGHRDTVFRKAGDLEIGDQLTMKMPYGDYSYEIVGTKIVSADDTSIINLQSS